eukprot:6280971-Lingulodinium_polyedra.AAC.1
MSGRDPIPAPFWPTMVLSGVASFFLALFRRTARAGPSGGCGAMLVAGFWPPRLRPELVRV